MKKVQWLVIVFGILFLAPSARTKITKMALPKKDIVAAVTSLLPQHKRTYFRVVGSLECSQINLESSGYGVAYRCTVKVDRKTAEVENPEVILQALQQELPMTEIYYSVTLPVTVTVVPNEHPPYEPQHEWVSVEIPAGVDPCRGSFS